MTMSTGTAVVDRVSTYEGSRCAEVIRNAAVIHCTGIQEDLNHGGMQWSRNLSGSYFSSSRN